MGHFIETFFGHVEFCRKPLSENTVGHDFNGHVINGIHEVNGKKCYYRAFHFVNKLYDFTGMLDLSGIFCYNHFFRKSHARLYCQMEMDRKAPPTLRIPFQMSLSVKWTMF